MPLKKSELYSSIWKSCDELRGGMDASQYKDYVLVLLFVKYVSDRYADPEGADLDVPAGARFADMVALGAGKNIGEEINKILDKLGAAIGLKGVFDSVDFNDDDKLGGGKDKVDRLSNLIAIFDKPELDFREADGDDLLGDAYEFLMWHFARSHTVAPVSLVLLTYVVRVRRRHGAMRPRAGVPRVAHVASAGMVTTSASRIAPSRYTSPRAAPCHGSAEDGVSPATTKGSRTFATASTPRAIAAGTCSGRRRASKSAVTAASTCTAIETACSVVTDPRLRPASRRRHRRRQGDRRQTRDQGRRSACGGSAASS